MPHILYGGVRYTQVRHAIKCKKCLETIESKYVHDYRCCSCKSVAIDGGNEEGNRILGNVCDIEDRRMYSAIIKKKRIWLPGSLTTRKENNCQEHVIQDDD
jgi:hypothetical protein